MDESVKRDGLKANVSRNETFSQHFYTFATEATAHGVNRFGNPQSGWPRRLFWLLLWLVMAAAFMRVIIAGSIKYLSYPYTTQVTYENIHNHTFPAVTICNNNYLQKSLLQNDSLARQFFEEIDLTKPEDLLTKPGVLNWTQNTEFISTFVAGAIPAEDFVSDCVFGLFPTQCPNITMTVTGRGICHTLSGFVNNKGEPIINTLPGIDFGFRFNVDIHSHEYSETRPSDGVGIIMIVHPNGVPPDINTAFAVAPGTEQYVALTVTQTSRLGLPCSEECGSEKYYSQEKCRETCVGAYVLEHCGCDFWGRMPSTMNCSLYQFSTCWGPAYDAVYLENNDDKCKCPLPCEETAFNVELSNMKYPSDAAVEKITARTGHSTKYLEKNIIAINLFFRNFIAQIVHQGPSYGLMEFAADAGGQMGLFLGASIISISEFLELLLDICLLKLNRRKMISPTAQK